MNAVDVKELLRKLTPDKKKMDVLELGAGKINRSHCKNLFHVCVDMSYDMSAALTHVTNWHSLGVERFGRTLLAKKDIFDFCDSYPYKFDLIIANRIFEHQFYDSGSIGRLLAECHTLLKDKGKLFITVPNHYDLAHHIMICEKSPSWIKNNNLNDILLTNTEFCNTKCDPHGSIWTPKLAKFYIESEGVWEIDKIYDSVNWEGRDCYMSVLCTKKS